MENLLAKLRISYSSLTMLQGVTDKPKDSTISSHTKLLDGFWEGQNDQCFISDVEREKQRGKTYLHLRLREMLRQHSQKASLIVMSLPMPRQVRIVMIGNFHTFKFSSL
jgi:solute carrier family 12 (sodium/potassium/chloride transporter), member 2